MLDTKPSTLRTTIDILTCIPTALVWGTAARFALGWIHGFHQGTVRIGHNTTSLEMSCVMHLMGFIAVSGMSASIFVCVKRRPVIWQAALFALGLLAFWMLAGD